MSSIRSIRLNNQAELAPVNTFEGEENALIQACWSAKVLAAQSISTLNRRNIGYLPS